MNTDAELLARLQALPRRIEPPADLWPAIDGALATRGRPAQAGPRRRPLLALVATLAVAAGVASWLGADRADRGGNEAAAAASDRGRLYARSVDLMYSGALRTLARASTRPPPVLDTGEAELSLRTIQHATEEIRAALAADPDAIYLAELLESTHRKRVELLKQLTLATDRPGIGPRMES